MSITSMLATAASGLRVAQTGLRVVSDNVANVNTPGYVRKIMDQTSVAQDGVGQGVDVARIRLAADRFLQAASLNAAGRGAEAGAVAGPLVVSMRWVPERRSCRLCRRWRKRVRRSSAPSPAPARMNWSRSCGGPRRWLRCRLGIGRQPAETH